MICSELDKTKCGRALLLRILFRCLICAATVVFLFALALYLALGIVSYGPSPAARDLFVISMLETSALKFLPRIYFSEDEIRMFVDANMVEEPEETGDMDLVSVARQPDESIADIVIDDVRGGRFKGKMMIVADPSRVMLGVANKTFEKGVRGKTVAKIIASYGGIGGINAGGFADEGGKGDGSLPLGVVISEGMLKWGDNTFATVIGFDNDNRLVIGKMTGREALASGVRDAVSFGPILVLNGTPLEIKGFGSGLNPRTAIGQRADGAVLLLTVDGRQLNSLGATMAEVVDLMVRYGAVNAANLDGGSSTVMYYQDALVNVCCSLYGPRNMPTAFIVRGAPDAR